MKKDKDLTTATMVAITLSIFAIVASIYHMQTRLDKLEAKKPVIVYQTDSAAQLQTRKITGKQVVDGIHTITVGPYGKFVVSEEDYNLLNVGDLAPDKIVRGSD